MNIVALILMIVGSLNWLLVGLFNFNLVTWIFGAGSVISIILYILVGLGGIGASSCCFSITSVKRPLCTMTHNPMKKPSRLLFLLDFFNVIRYNKLSYREVLRYGLDEGN